MQKPVMRFALYSNMCSTVLCREPGCVFSEYSVVLGVLLIEQGKVSVVAVYL